MRQAIVTGGSSGIGAAVVARLAADGYMVADWSRSSGFDVTNQETLRRAWPLTRQDAWVLCAGDVNPAPLASATDDEWERSLAVNLTHQFQLLRFIAQQPFTSGPVVLVASTAGLRPSPGWVTYSAAKAALVNLGITAAAELWAKNMTRVYVVAPGRCATPLRAKLAPDEDPTTIMQPANVAEVVMMCIGDRAGVLVGKVIEVGRLQ